MPKKDLKMRKSNRLTVVLWVSHILIIVLCRTFADSYLVLDGSDLLESASTSPQAIENKIVGINGARNTLRLVSDERQSSSKPLDEVEFGNIWAKNKDQLAADYQPSACQLVQIVHLLRHPGCQPKAIASFACSGSCPSYVRTSSSSLWQHERSCSCCQQTVSQEATFALDCPSLDPPYRKIKTYAPVECLCRSCTDLGREDLRPQELVEALANELNTDGQQQVASSSQNAH